MDSMFAKVEPYRIDIRQGNYLTQPMVAQLRKGMTKQQVQYILGRPMITDIFRDNRWDYVYRFVKGNQGVTEHRLLSVYFDEQGLLEHVDGDVIAGESNEALADSAEKPRVETIEIENSGPVKEKSWWQFW